MKSSNIKFDSVIKAGETIKKLSILHAAHHQMFLNRPIVKHIEMSLTD